MKTFAFIPFLTIAALALTSCGRNDTAPAADGSDERQVIHIEMSGGLADWTALNQAMRDSGDDFGLSVRSIHSTSATAYILTAKRRKFQNMCAANGWAVSSRDGVLRISK